MFDCLFQIRKQKALEEVEESEPQERIMAVLNFTGGLRVIKDGIKVFNNADSNKWRTSTITQRNVWRFWMTLIVSLDFSAVTDQGP